MSTAPAIERVTKFELDDMIAWQNERISKREFIPLGQLLTIHMGVCDDAAYFQKNVRERITSISRVQGLLLDWGQTVGPQVARLKDGDTLVFPRGVADFPKIKDPRYQRRSLADPLPPEISQDVCEYARGRLEGNDGTKFVVLGPILTLVIWPYSKVPCLLLMHGWSDNSGRYPDFLFDPWNHKGYFAGGSFQFDRCPYE